MMKSVMLILALVFSGNSFSQTGNASYYGPGFHGKKTASGQIFNMYGLTAAHKSLKFGTKARITNLKNKKSVIVLINDRGPYVKGRVIDLSVGAKRAIGMSNITKVSIEILK